MRILREPLFHFLLIGAAIFGLSLFTGRGTGAGSAPPTDKQIVVAPDKVALLKSGFALDFGRDPTDAEMQRLIDNYVREEVLVREARAQGLDRDDSIVRRRLVQKMEFAVAEPVAPSDSHLQQYLDQHSSEFRKPDGTTPVLSDIHGAVLAAWMNDQRKLEMDAMYQSLRSQYQVTVQPPPATKPVGGNGT